MSDIAWLEPSNVDDCLLNWAAWANSTDVIDGSNDSDINPVSMKYAIATDDLIEMLHYRDKRAISVEYRGRRYPVTEAALYTAKQAVEQGLKQRKLLT